MAAVSCGRQYGLTRKKTVEKDQGPMKGGDPKQAMSTLEQEKMEDVGLGGWEEEVLVDVKSALGISSRSNGHAL